MLSGVRACAMLCCALSVGPTHAADPHVQRQLQLRDQQQLELRLRMQQQSERAASPSLPGPLSGRQRSLEIEQQQALQQSHNQALRQRIPADAAAEPDGEAGRRTSQRDSTEIDRLSTQRRREVKSINP